MIKEHTPFYIETQKIINSDGSFNEMAFGRSLRKYLELLKKEKKSKKAFLESAGEWLTSYLARIVEYFESKSMSVESLIKMYDKAIEESTRIGIENITLTADNMKSLFYSIAESAKEKVQKNNSTDSMRKKIFGAALQVFGEKGYHRATIDEIVAFSGIGKGSVYRYFKNKEDLLQQLLVEKYDEIMEPMKQITSGDKDIFLQIQNMIELWISFIENNPTVYRLIQSEAITKTTGERTMFYDYFITHLPIFKDRILVMNREDKIKTTSFYSVVYGMLGFIDGIVHKWFRSGMDYPLRDEVPIIIENLFYGFVGESGPYSLITSGKKKKRRITRNP